MLAQRVDGIIGEYHRLQGVDSRVGMGGGVGGPPEVLDVQVLAGQRPGDGGVVSIPGCTIMAASMPLKAPFLHHHGLAAVKLFRRCADKLTTVPPSWSTATWLADRGAYGAGRDDVVAAGVPQPGRASYSARKAMTGAPP